MIDYLRVVEMKILQFACLTCLISIVILLSGCAVGTTVNTYDIPGCVENPDNIIDSIETTLAPADWSSEEHNITIVGNVLVIRTTERNHRNIKKHFKRLVDAECEKAERAEMTETEESQE